MHRFYLLMTALLLTFSIQATQSPHGTNFKLKCSDCHTTDRWNDVKPENFDHNKTRFPLVGQHKMVSCKKCHPTLVFTDAPTECAECHTDIHQQTVGTDCERCHTPESWLVKRSKVKDIHHQSGFPLVGAHAAADCQRCHVSGSRQRYEVINTECYSCHRDKYEATTTPNHRSVGFGTDCNRCHNMVGRTWNGSGQGFEHGFFPLKGGHQLECNQCHASGTYAGLSKECVSCHLANYNSTTNPNHTSSGFSKDCQTCHSINSWKGAKFDHDSKYFPIYSGTHRGQWNACTDCHTNPASHSVFTCLNCHEHNKASMDSEHRGRSGYVYNSANCLSCHPRGKAED